MAVKRLKVSLAVAILLASAYSAVIISANALAPSVSVVNLPAGSITTGIAYYQGSVYYASYDYGFVMKVNSGTLAYSNLTAKTGAFLRNYYGEAIDASGNLWLTRRSVPNPPALYGVGVSMVTPVGVEKMLLNVTLSVNTVSQTLPTGNIVLPNGTAVPCVGCNSWDGINHVGGSVYAASGTWFFKVGSTSPYPVSRYAISGGGGSYFGFVPDGSNNIWFSDTVANKVCKFDGASVTCYLGFTRPLGMVFSGGSIYVAENTANGNIDSFPTSNPAAITRVATTSTPTGVTLALGSVVWSSSSSDHKVCALGGSCVDTGKQNYFLTTDGSGKIFFSFSGSNGVGAISGLVSTTTYTFTSATLVSYDAQAGTLVFTTPTPSSTSSTSSTTTSTTSGAQCVTSYTTPCAFTLGQSIRWVEYNKVGTVTSINNGGSVIYTSVRSDSFCNGVSPGYGGCAPDTLST